MHGGGIQHVAGILGAQIHPVRPHRQIDIGELAALGEHRREQHGVGDMSAAPIRKVDHHHIAGMKVFDPHLLNALPNGVIVGAQE